MDSRKNTMEHLLDDIKNGVKDQGYFEFLATGIVNEFRDKNLVEYFELQGLKIELEGKMYIFTSL